MPLNACQRDFVYYGLSKSNPDTGILNIAIRERLYRFRLQPKSYGTISDSDEDPKLSDPKTVKGRDHQWSVEKLKESIWSGGVFDLKFEFFLAKPGESLTNKSGATYVYACSGSDLFDLSKVHRKFKKQTTFAKGVYKYYFNAENFVSKWFYPEGKQLLPAWDISEVSNQLMIVVTEVDPSEEISQTFEWNYNYSQNFNWKTDVGAEGDIKMVKVKIGFGLGGSKGQEKSGHTKYVVTTKRESDLLGSIPVAYQSRILESSATKQIDNQLVDGYVVRSTSAGNLVITLLPMDIR